MKQRRVQLTLIQIDNYGPWTNTLGSDREHRLQILQAELYSALQRQFSVKGGLVFFNRFDEILAVTNGVSRSDHEEIQSSLLKHFPFTVSMSIGVDVTPFKAHVRASKLLHATGGAQSEQRNGALTADDPIPFDEAYTQIIHIDVDGITNIRDRSYPFETSLRLQRVHLDLMILFKHLDSLLFYMGGDNFMAVTPELAQETVSREFSYPLNGLSLKFGIGRAQNARRAAEAATRNLEQIRHERNRQVISPCLRDAI